MWQRERKCKKFTLVLGYYTKRSVPIIIIIQNTAVCSGHKPRKKRVQKYGYVCKQIRNFQHQNY